MPFQRSEIKKLALTLREHSELSYKEIAREIQIKYRAEVSPSTVRVWLVPKPKVAANNSMRTSFIENTAAYNELEEINKEIADLLKGKSAAQRLAKLASFQLERRARITAIIDGMVEQRLAMARIRGAGAVMDAPLQKDLRTLTYIADAYTVPVSEILKAAEYIAESEEIYKEHDITSLMEGNQAESIIETDFKEKKKENAS